MQYNRPHVIHFILISFRARRNMEAWQWTGPDKMVGLIFIVHAAKQVMLAFFIFYISHQIMLFSSLSSYVFYIIKDPFLIATIIHVHMANGVK
jgi:hypothetical protein